MSHIEEEILMHGKCNGCDQKIFVRSVNDGQRKTQRYNDYYATSYYGLFDTDGDWRQILSRCCNRPIRRARTSGGDWHANVTMSLSQGNIYPH
jgi:hypothetical protein